MIPQARPDLQPSDFAHIRDILATRQIAGGPMVRRLERAFSRATGHDLVQWSEDGGVFRFLIKKAG